jgi:uncharacterized protein YgbK (DUF1537 family)
MRTSEVLAGLPAPWPDDNLRERIRRLHLDRAETLVVVDDDPTGCQTVADIPLLLDWSAASLRAEFAARPAVLYVLTNSRAKPAQEAHRLNRELAVNLRAAAAETGRAFSVVSRSDSTLRGHFPAETDGLAAVLGPFDGILLAPYFGDGGRLTIHDIHYVQRGDELVPAADTEFARDPVFGYASSNLRAWAEENGRSCPAPTLDWTQRPASAAAWWWSARMCRRPRPNWIVCWLCRASALLSWTCPAW